MCTKIICDRCGHEIHANKPRTRLDVTFMGEYKCYDLCPSCGEAFNRFLKTKPEEPDEAGVKTFKTAVVNLRNGLPLDAPEGAKAADYDISGLSKLVSIPKSTLRKMLRRAGLDGYLDVNKNNQPCRFWSMTEAAWQQLLTEIRKYRPRA